MPPAAVIFVVKAERKTHLLTRKMAAASSSSRSRAPRHHDDELYSVLADSTASHAYHRDEGQSVSTSIPFDYRSTMLGAGLDDDEPSHVLLQRAQNSLGALEALVADNDYDLQSGTMICFIDLHFPHSH